MAPIWKWTRVGVCPMTATDRVNSGVAPLNARLFEMFACYRLAHAGFLLDWLLPAELPARLPHLSVLITLGHGAFGDATRLALHQFLENGGVWIAIGSPCDAPDLLGVEPKTHPNGMLIQLGEGYACTEHDNPLFQQEWGLLHAFGGVMVSATDGTTIWARWLDPHARDTGLPAITCRAVGAGYAILYTLHVGETMARIQIGRPVSEPRLLPPDAPPDDETTMHSEDASRLDWYLDRAPCGDGQLCFAKPVADLWAESLTRAVLWAGQQRGEVTPMFWYYPNLAPAVSVLSILSEPGHADHETPLSHLLTLTGVRATWCLSEAIHNPNFYRDLVKREHEIGIRFQPDAEHFCRSSTLQGQVDNLRRFTGVRAITAVQVAELAWRGCHEFYNYAENAQLLSDLSRGGYHPQASGFPFGSAHPFRPPNPQRPHEPYALFTIPLTAYRAIEWVDATQANALLDQVVKTHGVYHITISPSVLASQMHADALMRLLGRSRHCGSEWRTAQEVATWLGARLNIRYKLNSLPGQMELGLLSLRTMHRFGLLLFTPLRGRATSGEQQIELTPAEFYGYPCLALTTDLVEKTVREIRLFELDSKAA
ncbi:MAG: hypothetical protein KatS3mg016_0723 [Fimbriimonadales bacterium]|nr:MAG: hypothetical protein KatS3mg016_0723 [Fimbriimonadales bacterium]